MLSWDGGGNQGHGGGSRGGGQAPEYHDDHEKQGVVDQSGGGDAETAHDHGPDDHRLAPDAVGEYPPERRRKREGEALGGTYRPGPNSYAG